MATKIWEAQSAGQLTGTEKIPVGRGGSSAIATTVNELAAFVNVDAQGLVEQEAQERQAADAEILARTDKVYADLRKVANFLYDVWYDELDYAEANKTFRANDTLNVGACSSIRKGSLFARNLDWYYSNCVEFRIHTNSTNGRYATVGMGGNIPALTNDFVASGAYSPHYRTLPFTLVDGINEKGLCVSVNVVPAIEGNRTTGTHAGKPDLCGMMIPRYMLDYHSSAEQACADVANNFNVYMPDNGSLSQEFHYLVADKNKTYLLEFINNAPVITDVTNTRPYITNFRMNGVTFSSDGSVNKQSVEDYGQGVERYDIITNGISSVNSVGSMFTLLQNLAFTKAYLTTTNPVWYTEFTDAEAGRKVTSPPSAFTEILTQSRNAYNNRQRSNPVTWQSVHSVVYDMENCTMHLLTQEAFPPGVTPFTYGLSVLPAIDELRNDVEGLQDDIENIQDDIEDLQDDIEETKALIPKLVTLTEAEYESLAVKDPDTYYYIIED